MGTPATCRTAILTATANTESGPTNVFWGLKHVGKWELACEDWELLGNRGCGMDAGETDQH